MTDRNGCFCGDRKLRRVEAARLIALAAQLPQHVPAAPSFNDVSTASPDYPYVESVANPFARRGVVLPPHQPHHFGEMATIHRLDFAAAAVRALGLQEEAERRSGETLGLADEADLSDEERGYAAVALSIGILSTSSDSSGESLRPRDPITRQEGARATVSMLSFVR